MRTTFIALILATALPATAQQSAGIYMHPSAATYSTTDSSQLMLFDNNVKYDLINIARNRQIQQNSQFFSLPDEQVEQTNINFVIFKRFLDRGLNRLVKSDYFKKSSVGKSAETVKKNTQTKVAIAPSTPTGIPHKFDLKVAAFQRQAFIHYSGFTNMQLRYSMRDDSFAALFRQNISNSGFIGFENRFNGETKGQFVTLTYIW